MPGHYGSHGVEAGQNVLRNENFIQVTLAKECALFFNFQKCQEELHTEASTHHPSFEAEAPLDALLQ